MRQAYTQCPECGEAMLHRDIPNHYADRHPRTALAVYDPNEPRKENKGGLLRWTDNPIAWHFYLRGEGMADFPLHGDFSAIRPKG